MHITRFYICFLCVCVKTFVRDKGFFSLARCLCVCVCVRNGSCVCKRFCVLCVRKCVWSVLWFVCVWNVLCVCKKRSSSMKLVFFTSVCISIYFHACVGHEPFVCVCIYVYTHIKISLSCYCRMRVKTAMSGKLSRNRHICVYTHIQRPHCHVTAECESNGNEWQRGFSVLSIHHLRRCVDFCLSAASMLLLCK